MKYTVERLPESRVAVDVELEPELVEKALNRAARRIAQKVRIPGFRPGKAPRYIVEGRFGRGALYKEIGDELIHEAYREILTQEKIRPVSEAELERMTLEPFTFRLIVPVWPTVSLGDYRSLRFPLEIQEVADEEVQAVLEQMQKEQTIWKPPAPLRPAREGDRLTLDLVVRVDGQDLEPRGEMEFALGEEDLPQALREHLPGMEVGQTVEVPVTLPEGFGEHSGKAAAYVVTVQAIKEPEVPPLNDDFARSFGEAETLEELRERIRGWLEEQALQKARGKVAEQMVTAIVEGAEVDMPAVLIEGEAEATIQEMDQVVERLQLTREKLLKARGKTEEEYRQGLWEAAASRVRRAFVLQEWLQAEGLAVEEDEVTAEIERLLAEALDPDHPEREAELREAVAWPAVRENVWADLLGRKIEERLVAIATGALAPAGVEEVVASAEGPAASGPPEATGEPAGTEQPTTFAGDSGGDTPSEATGKPAGAEQKGSEPALSDLECDGVDDAKPDSRCR